MKLLRHATAAFTANVATAAAQYALLLLVARGLGPDAFGTFMFALTFGSLVAVLPNFGLDRIVVRQVVREREAGSLWFAAAGVLRLGLGAIAMLVAALLLPAIAPPGQPFDTTLLIVLSLVVALAAELCRSVLYAFEALTLETGLRVVGRAIMLAAAALALLAGRTLSQLAVGLAAAAIIEAVVYLQVTVRRLGLHRQWPSSQAVRSLFVSAAPIACHTLFVLLYFRTNLLIVASVAGTAAAGQFGAAFTFVQVLQVASGSLASVLLPHFVHRETEGPAALASRIDTATRLLLAGIVPAAALLSLLAPEIVQIVYSSRFAAAAPALVVLAWAPVFMFMGSLHGSLLIVLDAERTLFWLSLVAAVVSVAANLVLIRWLGLLGASLATVGTEALVGLSCLALVRRRTGAPDAAAVAWPAVVALAAVALVASGAQLPLTVRLLAALGTAAASLLWMRLAGGPAWRSVQLVLTARRAQA